MTAILQGQLCQLLHTQALTLGAPYDSMFARAIMAAPTHTRFYSVAHLMTACLQGRLWQLLHTQGVTL